jgi:sRNA-binding carbon storage regulator CsrA
MLILTRRVGETLMVGTEVTVTVQRVLPPMRTVAFKDVTAKVRN